jgi:outer membrane protein OmpA-like peptidoglycan-associated protein
MKKYIFLLLASLPQLVSAQNDSTATENIRSARVQTEYRGLKNADRILPQWAIDVSYRLGLVNSTIDMFSDSRNLVNNISEVKYTDGILHGGNVNLTYFFGDNRREKNIFKSRRFGIGTGLYVNRTKGTNTIDNYQVAFMRKDKNQDDFRQLITAQGPLVEKVTTTNINIPLLFKYQHHFARKDKMNPNTFGILVEAGPLLGLSSKTRSTFTGKFDYEAIYQLDAANSSGIDFTDATNGNNVLYTREFIGTKGHINNTPGGVNAYFEQKAADGLNVGLDKEISKSEKSEYTQKPHYGFIVQPAVTYQLGYNLGFVLGYFASLQMFENKPNASYRLTDDVQSYSSMVKGTEKNTVFSHGVNIGLRYYFGEKRDIDYDKVIDILDECDLVPGKLRGCPDSDGDGVADKDDDCRDQAGLPEFRGCPDDDGDGFVGSDDECPEEAGNYNGCPFAKAAAKFDPGKICDSVRVITKIEEEFIELSVDRIKFDVSASAIRPEYISMLDRIAGVLNANKKFIVFIHGHTDNTGSVAYNQRLSQDRANAVGKYLIDKGIDESRVVNVGYNSRRPIDENTNDEGKANNRRSEIKILKPVTK